MVDTDIYWVHFQCPFSVCELVHNLISFFLFFLGKRGSHSWGYVGNKRSQGSGGRQGGVDKSLGSGRERHGLPPKGGFTLAVTGLGNFLGKGGGVGITLGGFELRIGWRR